VANIAEGAGRVTAADKRRFYGIARASATETAALLDVLRGRGALTAEARDQARHKLLRVVQMRERLCLSR
jgi:four helix bundle protein